MRPRLVTIALITVGTIGIALTPYASIGLAAPSSSLPCRLVRGWPWAKGPSTTYLIEIAPQWRGLYGGWRKRPARA